MSRDVILGRIRAALARPTPEHPTRPSPPIDPLPAPAWPTLADGFAERFQALGGHWLRASSAEAVGDYIGGLAKRHGPGPVWIAEDAAGLLDRAGVPQALAARGQSMVRRWAEIADPDQVPVAVTGITAAIAESGTLCLLAEPGQGRLASVVTPVHVAVITADQVVASLGQALSRLAPALRDRTSSAAIFITGPSRTADIEGQLVVGVHGPTEIHCVLLER